MHERLFYAWTRGYRCPRALDRRGGSVALVVRAVLIAFWCASLAAPLAASVPRSVSLVSQAASTRHGVVPLFDRSGMIAVDRAREVVYVGTAGRGVFEIRLGSPRRAPHLRSIAPGLWTTAMATTDAGTLWFGGFDGSSYQGAFRWESGALSVIREEDGLASNYITCIVPLTNVDTLMGSLYGAQRVSVGLQGISVSPTTLSAGRFVSVNDLVSTGDEMLIASDWGLFRADGSGSTLLTTASGEVSFKVNSVHRDAAARVWLATDAGLKYIADGALTLIDDMPGHFPGRADRIREHPDTHDIWFLCNGELAVLREGAVQRPLRALLPDQTPAVDDYGFVADGVAISQRGVGVTYVDLVGDTREPPEMEAYNVRARVLRVTFTGEEYITHNLDGRGWSKAERARALVLTGLSPGPHRLSVARVSTVSRSPALETVEFKAYQYFCRFGTVASITAVLMIAAGGLLMGWTHPSRYRWSLGAMAAVFSGIWYLNDIVALLQTDRPVMVLTAILLPLPALGYVQYRLYLLRDLDEDATDDLYSLLKGFDHGAASRRALFRLIRLIHHARYRGCDEPMWERFVATRKAMLRYVLPEMDQLFTGLMRWGRYHRPAARCRRSTRKLQRHLQSAAPVDDWARKVSARDLEQAYELVRSVRADLVSEHYSCEVLECCRDVLEENGRKLREHGIELVTNADAVDIPTGARVIIRDHELYKVVDNLIANAVAAMGASAYRRLHGQITDKGRLFLISVSDTGAGLDPRQADRIFDNGYTTKDDPTAGVGLYYSRQTLARYGGRIRVADTGPGAGTTMEVELPVVAGTGSAAEGRTRLDPDARMGYAG